MAALEYLTVFPKKRLSVLQPMIELGIEAVVEHERVLKRALTVCETIFLTNSNYYSQFIAKLPAKDHHRLVVIKSKKRFMKDICSRFGRGDVILFEGRESGLYLDKFKNV